MKAGLLAEKLGYEIACGNDEQITGISWAKAASEDQIAVCRSKRDISCTKAKVVLTDLCTIKIGKTMIFVNDPMDLAVAKVIRCMIEIGLYDDYSQPGTLKITSEMSAIGENVQVGSDTILAPFVTIERDVVIGDNCYIGGCACIKRGSIIGNNVRIGCGTVIGADAFYHYMEGGILKTLTGVAVTIVEDDVFIGNDCSIQRGVLRNTVIGYSTHIGNMVDVGHDVVIGDNCKIVSQTGIAGNAVIGNHVRIFGQVGVANDVIIGDYATVIGKSSVTKNVKKMKTISGMHGREHGDELRVQARMRKF